MPDTITIKTSGMMVLGEEQAKHFAISIFSDVKTYVKAHRSEFEAWKLKGSHET